MFHFCPAAFGEIGTAESPVEQRIPGEERTRDAVVEADPSRGVAGSGDDLQDMVPEIEDVGRAEDLAGYRAEVHPEHVRDRDGTVPGGYHRSVWVIGVCGTSELLRDGPETAYVVRVAMGEEHGGEPGAGQFPPYGSYGPAGIQAGARIDQNGGTALYEIDVRIVGNGCFDTDYWHRDNIDS